MRFVLAFLAFMAPAAAFAQCSPPNAGAGTMGCQPALGAPQSTDLLLGWRPSAFPSSTGTLTVGGLFSGLIPFTGPITGPSATLTGSAGLTVTNNASVGGTLTAGASSQAYLQMLGGTTSGGPALIMAGADTGSPLNIEAPSGGSIRLYGPVNIWQSGLVLTPSGSWTGGTSSSTAGLFMAQNFTGTNTGGGVASAAYFAAYPNMNAGTGAGNWFDTLTAVDNLGGSSTIGNFNALGAELNVTAATGNATGAGGTYVAAHANAYANVNDNGTLGAEKGLLYGFNSVVSFGASATHWNSLIGYEDDITAPTGSSMTIRIGEQIVDVNSQVQGSFDDDALVIANTYTQGSGAGWKYGLIFGRSGGDFPMAATGTMIGAISQSGTMDVANGIDWSGVTASVAWLKFGSVFTVDGTGNITITTPATGTAASYACFTSAGKIISSATAC